MRPSPRPLLVAALVLAAAWSGDARAQRSFSDTKAAVADRLTTARKQISAATLTTSPALAETRRAIAKPFIDGGYTQFADVFKEKRSALITLSSAKSELAAAEKELEAARGQAGLWPHKRLWVSRTSTQLKAAQAELAAARKDLSRTTAVWSSLSFLFSMVHPDEKRILRALVDDREEHQPLINDYIRSMTQ